MPRRPRLHIQGLLALAERDVDVRAVLGDGGDNSRAARAVVCARAAEDGNRRVVRLSGHEALQAQRALRELGLDVAEALTTDEGADTAVEAGVVAREPVAEAEAVALD